MICMNLSELIIHRNRNRNNFIDLLSADSLIPHIEIEGSVSSIDIPEINEMFCRGPIYLMTKAEAEEYLELKHAEEVRKFKEAAKTKEEETMKNVINGKTEVVTIGDMPRQVIPGTSEYDDAAWCPSCAALFRKGTPNWGREVCGHCGQPLEWPKDE